MRKEQTVYGRNRHSRAAWAKFLLTRLAGLAIDSIVLAVAYVAAFALRLDFHAPSWGWRATAQSFAVVCAVHLIALVVAGVYRLSWRRIRGCELPRYIGAMVLACVMLTAMRLLTPDVSMARLRPPYSVTLISFFLGTIGIVGVRVLWRLYWEGRCGDEALLERKVRTFDNQTVARFFAGRTVMVTGAGGSIGGEIVRQLLAAGVAKVLMVERSEGALYEIDRALCDSRAVALMRDVNDCERMREVVVREKPSVILHAAAYKHVPMVERNPEEGWRNNAEATRRLADLALETGVERFVLISTDKAVNPVSVMGKTKRAAELAVMELNERARRESRETSFCAVRFGNVFGSSGSVVQLFREQIARKQPLTVTHPEMRRYFMTIQEAVSLVLQAATRQERAIYTLDMGPSVRIVDLAEGMIEQAGYRPYVDIPIVFTGVRPGEKLFEEIDVSEKACFKTDMAKIYITKG